MDSLFTANILWPIGLPRMLRLTFLPFQLNAVVWFCNVWIIFLHKRCDVIMFILLWNQASTFIKKTFLGINRKSKKLTKRKASRSLPKILRKNSKNLTLSLILDWMMRSWYAWISWGTKNLQKFRFRHWFTTQREEISCVYHRPAAEKLFPSCCPSLILLPKHTKAQRCLMESHW